MPYRRLPNTDSARLRALQTAFAKGKELPPFKLAFSQQSLRKLHSIIPQFEKALLEYRSTFNHQVRKNKEYLQIYKRAKLYISHFIQVMNMSVNRGELPAITRTFFGMGEQESYVPDLNTERSVLEWGEKIIKGENQRRLQGLTPITNPAIALVKVRYEQFVDAYKFQKTLQADKRRAMDNIVQLRVDVDAIILAIWNEVEEFFKDLPDNLMREKSAEYGVSYVFRKNELRKINLSSTLQFSMF